MRGFVLASYYYFKLTTHAHLALLKLRASQILVDNAGVTYTEYPARA